MKRQSETLASDSLSSSSRLGQPQRKGRPAASMAGEVEERILEAATAVFLAYGFAGASLDRIVEKASASKATFYSRYAGKEVLFAAVVKRSVERSMRIIHETPQFDSLLERLVFANHALLSRLLSDEVVGLVRMVVADAVRFPSLAQLTHERGRLSSIDALTTVIAEHSRQLHDTRSKAALGRKAKILATQILDAIVAPLMLRAMLGQELEGLRREINAHIEKTLAIFVAAKAFDPFL